MLYLQLLVDGLLMGCIYALNAAGMSLVFGVIGLVNFAYADFLMISMYTCFWMFTLFAIDPLISLPLAVIVCALMGYLTYQLVIRKVVDSPQLTQTMATYAWGMILRYACVFAFSMNYRYLNNTILDGTIVLGGIHIEKSKLVAAIICVVAFAGLITLLNKTKIGLSMRATSQDRTAAALMGMNSKKVFTIAFILGCCCVAVAGAVLVNSYYVFPLVGQNFGNINFAVVALGGFGSVSGSLIAGLIIGVVESFGGFFFDSSYKYAIVFLVYILVILFKPKGLKGV